MYKHVVINLVYSFSYCKSTLRITLVTAVRDHMHRGHAIIA